MRTLRDEAMRIGRERSHYLPSYDTFLSEYGDYRVAEGVLHAAHSGKGAHIHPAAHAEFPVADEDSWVEIGTPGDTVKLILPPEEKAEDEDEVSSLQRRLLAANSDKRDARHRADTFEEALREIRDYEVSDAWEVVALTRKRIAEEALDEGGL